YTITYDGGTFEGNDQPQITAANGTPPLSGGQNGTSTVTTAGSFEGGPPIGTVNTSTITTGGGTGSRSWHWHAPEPINSYEVENSMGQYDLYERISDDGVQYYEGQNSNMSATQKNNAFAVQNRQEEIVDFQQQFNGTWPFTSDGDIV